MTQPRNNWLTIRGRVKGAPNLFKCNGPGIRNHRRRIISYFEYIIPSNLEGPPHIRPVLVTPAGHLMRLDIRKVRYDTNSNGD